MRMDNNVFNKINRHICVYSQQVYIKDLNSDSNKNKVNKKLLKLSLVVIYLHKRKHMLSSQHAKQAHL